MTAEIESLDVAAYEVPTATKTESDGTLEWDATTLILVRVSSGGVSGIGFGYSHHAAARLIDDHLRSSIEGADAMATSALWRDMAVAIRNLGFTGLAMMAVSAVDVAVWDLKARLLEVSLAELIGPLRDEVPVYGSGGFCNYSEAELREQMSGWVEQGMTAVKMKVARNPGEDLGRIHIVRDEIGDEIDLLVDANGAFHDAKRATEWGLRYAEAGAVWLEEPVSSDDLEGLAFVRDHVPAGMDVTAGEYGFNPNYFHHMLNAGAVDVIQPDVTRCGGITALLEIGGLCAARNVPLSGHTAPSIHAHVLPGLRMTRHLEYFFDHTRIEQMLFDGTLEPDQGVLRPDPERPGLGLDFKEQDAEKYLVFKS